MSKFFLGKLFSKGKVSPTIKSVNPNVGKPSKSALNKQIQKTKASGAKLKQTLFESKNKAFKGDDFTFSETKKGKGKQSRVRKMGGGMMGRRMGYSEGSSKGKIPTTPKEKSLAKLAPPRNRITFGDVVAGRTKGKRMQAKDGTIPFNKQKNIIDKQGKRGIIVGTGTMEASPKVKTAKRKNERRR